MGDALKNKTYSFASYVDNITSLHSLIETLNLRKYYEGTSICDNPRFTSFMDWLIKNDSLLLNALKSDIKSGKVITTLKDEKAAISLIGCWLGGRYIASIYKKSDKENFPKLIHGSHSAYYPSAHSIELCSRFLEKIDKTESFLISFNMGIHEYTHALGKINGKNVVLSEMATFFSQTSYALPLKTSLTKKFYGTPFAGVRNFIHTLDETNSEPEKSTALLSNCILFDEYLSFIIGPWLKKYYDDHGKKINIFEFEEANELSSRIKDFIFGSLYFITAESFMPESLVKLLSLEKVFFDFLKERYGIKDKNFLNKFKEVLAKFKEEKEVDSNKIMNRLLKCFSDVFGPITEVEIPDGFVSLTPSKNILKSKIKKVA